MLALWNALNGAKTYIIAFSAILAAWVAVWNNAMDVTSAIEATFAALTAAGLRHGMPAK